MAGNEPDSGQLSVRGRDSTARPFTAQGRLGRWAGRLGATGRVSLESQECQPLRELWVEPLHREGTAPEVALELENADPRLECHQPRAPRSGSPCAPRHRPGCVPRLRPTALASSASLYHSLLHKVLNSPASLGSAGSSPSGGRPTCWVGPATQGAAISFTAHKMENVGWEEPLGTERLQLPWSGPSQGSMAPCERESNPGCWVSAAQGAQRTGHWGHVVGKDRATALTAWPGYLLEIKQLNNTALPP